MLKNTKNYFFTFFIICFSLGYPSASQLGGEENEFRLVEDLMSSGECYR
jgi:hypothetical protein